MVHDTLDIAMLVRHRARETLDVGLPWHPAAGVLKVVRVVAGGELVVVAAGGEEVLPVPVLVRVSLALVTLPDGGRVVQMVFHAGVPAGVHAGPVHWVAVDAVRLSCASSNVSKEVSLLSYRRET